MRECSGRACVMMQTGLQLRKFCHDEEDENELKDGVTDTRME